MEIVGWLIFLPFAAIFFWFWIKVIIYVIKMFKGLGEPPTHDPLDDGVDENYPWHEGPP